MSTSLPAPLTRFVGRESELAEAAALLAEARLVTLRPSPCGRSSATVSQATVKTHLVHIFSKLGIDSRSELVAEAVRRGVQPHPSERG